MTSGALSLADLLADESPAVAALTRRLRAVGQARIPISASGSTRAGAGSGSTTRRAARRPRWSP
ncbi:hypothetical protein ACVGVM_15195 [Pseudonocardia bannensis]|uniref:Uncharacterized protein n=1 Tax=Pseudonocardia bannensis TaxID=630973 RepID=A0A848DE80_9PSEU|nr:hypothetical protein [Pseudonocardia bannensis]NMH90894.1 hypothetical protein [Pseudonocardia bannensis]